ncbi:hypothetical protein GM609_03295 [Bombella sp. ESL0387]|nr:hypothetical protein [Bombella sp. ESL0387]
MIILFLMGLWAAVWLLHLNRLPTYRRQNPCHLPPAGTLQTLLHLALPAAGLTGACLLEGLDGLFLWAFTAPATGFLLGLTLPHLPHSPAPKGRNLQNHRGTPRYLP